jgi:hypothetical protein
VKPVAFLRDATPQTLSEYAAMYLLDVPRLDGGAAQALQAYITGGGGVAIFAGPDINPGYYNQALYQEGRGILPAPLGAEATLPPALDPSEADVVLSNHPIFSFFQSETNPLIRGVKINQYRMVATGWKPTAQDAVEVLAQTRDKTPLVLSKKLGRGEVVLFLTSLAPKWNDWAKNPSFVVVALKLQSYLASAQRPDDPRLVGTPLDLSLESSRYLQDVAFVTPGEKAGSRQRIERPASGDAGEASTPSVLTAFLGRAAGETDRAGVYEAWLRTTKGETEVRRWAFNVEPDEGDLTTVAADDLSARLDPVRVNYHVADQYQQDEVASSGYNLSMLMMGGLVLLLVGEQLLAYSASYHVTQGANR